MIPRVNNGEKYYYLTSDVLGTRLVIRKHYDYGHEEENRRYEEGNYFTSLREAMKTAAEIYCIFNKR